PAQSPRWKPHLLTTAAPPVRAGSMDQVAVASHRLGAKVVELCGMDPCGCPGVFLAQAFELEMSCQTWAKLRSPLLPSCFFPRPTFRQRSVCRGDLALARCGVRD